jgi:hypothetical protein
MSDGYAIQTTIKHGPNMAIMTNVRGDTPEEFESNLEAALGKALSIADLADALIGSVTVASAFPGTQMTNSQVNAPAATSDPAERKCKHGVMRWIEKPEYAGHFCPAEKGDDTRCKPEYAKKGGR